MRNVSDELASDSPNEMDGRLNIAERMVARVGAWAGALTARCQPPAGPFFLADGRLTYTCASWEQDEAGRGVHQPL